MAISYSQFTGKLQHILSEEILSVEIVQTGPPRLFRIRTASKSYAAKIHPLARNESHALCFLTEKHIPAPWVHFVDDELLLLDWLEGSTGLSHRAESDLARELGRLHQITSGMAGWSEPQLLGHFVRSACLEGSWNEVFESWINEQLVHLVALEQDDLKRARKAIDSAIPFLPNEKRLCHGDLWTGNILANRSIVTGFLDPCLTYADPVLDLAMLSLFGGVGHVFWDAYGELGSRIPDLEIRPQSPDFKVRLHSYQLYYLTVHVRKDIGYVPSFLQTLQQLEDVLGVLEAPQ